jgi:hypothetical protein
MLLQRILLTEPKSTVASAQKSDALPLKHRKFSKSEHGRVRFPSVSEPNSTFPSEKNSPTLPNNAPSSYAFISADCCDEMFPITH